MRGSRTLSFQHIPRRGIIPAHAGLTPTPCVNVLLRWDHPRACGAHYVLDGDEMSGTGSSPRMRGSRSEAEEARDVIGIIPAHAGLTPLAALRPFTLWDHPRACGAHRCAQDNVEKYMGSSPRMRGSPPIRYRRLRAQGIIPAHAGLTYGPRRFARLCRDHPRACGAHETVRR